MNFGFGAPVSGPLSGPRDLARIVSEGEAMGYDYCTLSDHVVIPRDMEKKYPYSDTARAVAVIARDEAVQDSAMPMKAPDTSKAATPPANAMIAKPTT